MIERINRFRTNPTITNRIIEDGEKHRQNGALLAQNGDKVITNGSSVNGRRRRLTSLLAALLLTLTACTANYAQQKGNAVIPANRPVESQKGATDAYLPNSNRALVGTHWRLVKIMSMDDHVYVPDDGSRYTLEFKANGSIRLRADCNIGSGSWTSAAVGQLRFGQIVATRAMCPSRSLHDRYIAQFPWVRSYIIKDGRLFLATMADGSIIEFEPMQ